MAGRFPLYTDADIQGPLIEALRARGWDVVRAVERFPEGTEDPVHFEEAARLGRVLVSNDEDQLVLGAAWLAEGRPFAGLITWPQEHYGRMAPGEIVEQFEELAARSTPFGGYPIVFLKPRR